MKAGTQNHLKTKRLMRLAGIPLYRAVGILETLWLLCQDCCDEGNIGKFTDDEIADYLGWDGPNASDLVRHLSDSGWIDPDPAHRYVIHDWLDNCPEFIRDRVRKRRARASICHGQRTYAHSEPDNVGQGRTTSGQDRSCPVYSQPIPTNPIQSQPPPKSPSESDAAPGQRPSAGLVAGGGLDMWDLDSEARARLCLTMCGYNRVDELLRQCRECGITPGDIVSACDEFRANKGKFTGPGAIAERLRSGHWPVNGVLSPKSAEARKSSAGKSKRGLQVESLRRQLIRQKVNEARDWADDQVIAEAKNRGMVS